MHNNLFRNLAEPGDVYAALQAHQKRDYRNILIADLIAAGCLIAFFFVDSTVLKATLSMLFFSSAITGVRTFIDMSNRNFFMHKLDWEAEEQHRRFHEARLT